MTSKKFSGAANAMVLPPSIKDLTPYDGPWEYAQAGHLLRRVTFGPTVENINEAVELGFEGVFERLFEERPMPGVPLNNYFEDDPYVGIGETWIDAPYIDGTNLYDYRWGSMQAWTIENILEQGIHLREKLTLFWHNHFGLRTSGDPKFAYRYINLLRRYSWGNVRDLVKEVTIDPAMLIFLNGNQNTERAPNENYARELLELYTVGKGPLAGPGDYTTFTEEDVAEIARVLTGWRDIGEDTLDPEVTVGVEYVSERHDTGVKQLSLRFNNAVISNEEEKEYSTLIDIIFEQQATAKHICRKLYRWFVYYVIEDDVEEMIIGPMAQTLIDNDYDIKPVISLLLRSEHFFDFLNQGPMIKNPIDFVISTVRQTYLVIPETLNEKYISLQEFYEMAFHMDMEYYEPPQVAGWSSYYQAPSYYRRWINGITMRFRMNYTRWVAKAGIKVRGIRMKADPFKIMEVAVAEPLDPNSVVRGFTKALCPLPLTDEQHDALKEILIPGLPDFEWTVEYGQFVENPEDSDLAESIEDRLRNLLEIVMQLPEFHLS